MRKTQEIEPVNLTPMIDIVFQMIIFFITTVDLDKDKFDKEMSIPEAPHASEAKPEPATIYLQVKRNGTVYIGTTPLPSDAFLAGMLKKAMSIHGQNIPVVIHGDGYAEHRHVRRVMDVVSKTGIWRINFSAIQKKGS
ncbi:MAG: biopolymer transport protein ExbD [Kiritimatiellia bacterium]|jgi:biopolymer transport protein ExbD